MSEENKNMDNSFKKMNEDLKVTYDKSFWNDAQKSLENDSLDDAFRNAASKISVTAGITAAANGLGDAFMDDAFNEAALQSKFGYSNENWTDFESKESNLLMNEAFVGAAKQVKTAYNPSFWGDANSALEKEGLHHEYNAAYWSEAKALLDKADQSKFYFKWTTAAIALLLLSAFGLNNTFTTNYANTNRKAGAQDFVSNKNQFNENLAIDNEETQASIGQNDLNKSINSINFISENNRVESNIVDSKVENFDRSAIFNKRFTESNEVNNIDLIDEDNTNAEGFVEDATFVNHTSNEDSDFQIDQTEELDQQESSGQSNDFKNESNKITSSNIAKVNRDYKLLGLSNNAILESTAPFANIQSVLPEVVHTVSIFGDLGMGNNYGDPSVAFTKRYGVGIQYLRQGNGKLHNFEIGGSAVVKRIDFEGLRASQLRKYYNDNGEVPRSWYDVIFYNNYSAGVNYLMNYKFNSKHKLLFGLGVDYIFSVKTNLSYLTEQDNDIQTFNNNWGVQNGINPIDANISLGYEFQPVRQLGITVKTNFGLVDRTNNNFFSTNLRYNNEMNVTVGLRYTLFTKI